MLKNYSIDNIELFFSSTVPFASIADTVVSYNLDLNYGKLGFGI